MTPEEHDAFDRGEGPATAEEARGRIKAIHDDPRHKFLPGPDGTDPRDELTRGDPLPDDFDPEA